MALGWTFEILRVPWGALGGLGYPWRVPRGSKVDFCWILGVPWEGLGHSFRKNKSLDYDLSLHIVRMVRGIIS